MYHEHQHPERNLVLLLDGLPPDATANNYEKVTGEETSQYDPTSVMHYEAGDRMCVPKEDASGFCDFGQDASSGCKVATQADCDKEATRNVIGQRNGGLSDGDVEALRTLYGGNGGDDNNGPSTDDEDPDKDPDQPDEDGKPDDIGNRIAHRIENRIAVRVGNRIGRIGNRIADRIRNRTAGRIRSRTAGRIRDRFADRIRNQ